MAGTEGRRLRDWLHVEMVDLQVVTDLSTNQAEHGATSLM